MMLPVDEPGTGRRFANDMRGLLYSVSHDDWAVTRYLDLTAAMWELSIQARGNEVEGFAVFHFSFGPGHWPGPHVLREDH